eukprot:m.232851 g.232851  ORF g.232851 m.232851 type:complete len:367 (-) comp17078_c6_seq1:1030-2130(-)
MVADLPKTEAGEWPWYHSILSELAQDYTELSDSTRMHETQDTDQDSLAYKFRNLYTNRLDYRERKLAALQPYSKSQASSSVGAGSKRSSKRRTKKGDKHTSSTSLQLDKGSSKTKDRKRMVVDEPIIVSSGSGTHVISAGGRMKASSSGMTHEDWLQAKAKEEKRRAAKKQRQKEKELHKELEQRRKKQQQIERGHAEYSRWLEKEERKRKEKKRREREKAQVEAEQREQRLQKLLTETDENFKEWLFDYHIRRRKADEQERERRRKEAELRKAAQERGQAAFEKWRREIELRPKHLRFEQSMPWRGVLEDDETQTRKNGNFRTYHDKHFTFSKRQDEDDHSEWVPSPPLLFRDLALAEMGVLRRR